MANKKKSSAKQALPPPQPSASGPAKSNHLAQPAANAATPPPAKLDSRWSGGSWRGKATAVAEVARENIAVSANGTLDSLPKQSDDEVSTPASKLSRSFRTPSKSAPSAASMTKITISSNSQDESKEAVQDSGATDDNSPLSVKEIPASSEVSKSNTAEAFIPGAGWRGWWTKPVENEKTTSGNDTLAPDVEDQSTKPANIANSTPNNTTKTDLATTSSTKQVTPVADTTQNGIVPEGPSEHTAIRDSSSWFGLWYTGQNSVDDQTASALKKSRPSDPTLAIEAVRGESVSHEAATALLDTESNKDNLPDKVVTVPQLSAPRLSSGSWAFWSREKAEDLNASSTQTHQGELAVAGTSSQSKPEKAEVQDLGGATTVETQSSKRKERPVSLNLPDEASAKRISGDKASGSVLKVKSEANTPQGSPAQPSTPQLAAKDPREKPVSKSLKLAPPNLLLPSLRSTFRVAESPSYWQQISRLLGREKSSNCQLAINPNPSHVRKALAIGVHGYFPTPLVQKIIGQPTGTSIRFANEAAASIQKWAEAHNHSCDVEKVALEGEGLISERAETLWKLLLNWIDQIRRADFILVACHSQGVPVAVMLVARLVEFGCIGPSTRIGICAMAGVNLGPFSDYKSRFFGGSAAELFEFSRPHSDVSKKYEIALKTVLASGVRVIYVGSIDDQLVSMESSTFSTVNHPYIYRAVFVDGRIHAPDFITHLVGFALKLRNMGVSDHGLIRELSLPLAGSLYTGEGHSRIYEDQAVYDLAVEFTLETNMVPTTMLEVRKQEPASNVTSNPYFLPWAMRGALEEEIVRTQLKADTDALLKQFEDWKPISKGLKDVKFRLEAVKSKLA